MASARRHEMLRISAWILGVLLVAALLIAPGAAEAYEVFLDIDLDGDPATRNLFSEETTAQVRIVLSPTEPDEVIEHVVFGLGGTCRECDLVQQYGVEHDLVDWQDLDYDWSDHPDLESWWDAATLLGCPDDPGYHLVLFAEPYTGSMVLTEPVFIATFTAWVAEPPPGCSPTPSNLATMFQQGYAGVWSYIQIGGPAIATERSHWGTLKSLYR